MNERFMHATYCDDIRYEVGHKRSLMGIFAGRMYVDRLPITLPKLCVVAEISTPVNRPLKTFCLRLLKDDQEVGRAEYGPDILTMHERMRDNLPEEDQDEARLVIITDIILSPLALDGPCKLRLRADTEEGEIKGPALRIQMMPDTPLPPPTPGLTQP